MKELEKTLAILGFGLLLLSLAAIAHAAPPECTCNYCEANPQQWCSCFGGHTGQCSDYLFLYCEGGALESSALPFDEPFADLTLDESPAAPEAAEAADAPEPASAARVESVVAADAVTP